MSATWVFRAAAIAWALAGCDPPPVRPGPPPGIDPWARDGSAAASGTGRTLTFAISSVTIEPLTADPTAISGFDFDRRYGTGAADEPFIPHACGRLDAPSELDIDSNCPTEHWDPRTGLCAAPGCDPRLTACIGGVDNQLPLIASVLDDSFARAGLDYRQFVGRMFAQGHSAMIVRVHDVDSLDDDPFVRVSLVRAVPAFGPPCDATVDGQRYLALRSWVLADDPQRAWVTSSSAWIQGGRLRARFTGNYPFPFADWSPGLWEWPVERLQLAVDLREDRGVRGNFGAVVLAQTVIDHRSPSGGYPIPSLVSSFVDIEYFGVCRDPNRSQYGAIGVGFAFGLTRAALSDRVADGAQAGACPNEPLVITQADGSADGGDATR